MRRKDVFPNTKEKEGYRLHAVGRFQGTETALVGITSLQSLSLTSSVTDI